MYIIILQCLRINRSYERSAIVLIINITAAHLKHATSSKLMLLLNLIRERRKYLNTEGQRDCVRNKRYSERIYSVQNTVL